MADWRVVVSADCLSGDEVMRRESNDGMILRLIWGVGQFGSADRSAEMEWVGNNSRGQPTFDSEHGVVGHQVVGGNDPC